MEAKPTIETVLERLSAYTSSLDLNSLDLEQLEAVLENCLRELGTSLGICPDIHETDPEVNNLIIDNLTTELGLLSKLEEKLQELEEFFKLQGSEKSSNVKTILQQMLRIVRQKKCEIEQVVQDISESLESAQSREPSQSPETPRRQPPPSRGWER